MSDKRWTVAGKRGSWGNPEHLLWPDDQDTDLPHKFTASHMGEAWPNTPDSIVDAAFAALVDDVKAAACLRSSDARLTLDGPDGRGWYVLRMDGAPVADLDPVESAAVAEVISRAAQVLPSGVPLMQVDHAQPVPSSPDSGESRSSAAGPESEHADLRRAGAPPHEASRYACERALLAVADLTLLVQILWARYPVMMSPGQMGTFIDSLPDDHQFALMAATGQTYKGVSWESDHPTCVLIRELENQEEQG